MNTTTTNHRSHGLIATQIELHSTARSAEDIVGASKFRKSQRLRLYKRTLAAAALAAGLVVQTPGFAQVAISASPSARTATDAATTPDPEEAEGFPSVSREQVIAFLERGATLTITEAA